MIDGERRRCHAGRTNTTSLLFGDDSKYRVRRVDRGGRVTCVGEEIGVVVEQVRRGGAGEFNSKNCNTQQKQMPQIASGDFEGVISSFQFYGGPTDGLRLRPECEWSGLGSSCSLDRTLWPRGPSPRAIKHAVAAKEKRDARCSQHHD